MQQHSIVGRFKAVRTDANLQIWFTHHIYILICLSGDTVNVANYFNTKIPLAIYLLKCKDQEFRIFHMFCGKTFRLDDHICDSGRQSFRSFSQEQQM